MPVKGRSCTTGVWDESIPDIYFDAAGKSSYCKLQEKLILDYPKGDQGLKRWELLVEKIRKAGKGKKYDCIAGVSGGTDSSYLLHICRQYDLRVLAVNLDNGWSSDIALRNIKNVTKKLGYDLLTYVIDYEEVKSVLRAYLKASLPWIDSPTDMAIASSLYMTARKEKIKYILNGSDFRTEGKQPFQWTYSDSRQFRFLVKKYENTRIRSFPVLSLSQIGYLSIIRGIKVIRPYYFLDYSKQNAQEDLKRLYDWEYYGGHHHENHFTKFIISYWMYEKFGIDKRKITFSAQIMNGDLTREEAIARLDLLPYDPEQIDNQIDYVCKKLDISRDEFTEFFNRPNRFYYDYPNSQKLVYYNLKLIRFLSSIALHYIPSSIAQMEQEKSIRQRR
jgi:N-acetyl sugar amidotransferase